MKKHTPKPQDLGDLWNTPPNTQTCIISNPRREERKDKGVGRKNIWIIHRNFLNLMEKFNWHIGEVLDLQVGYTQTVPHLHVVFKLLKTEDKKSLERQEENSSHAKVFNKINSCLLIRSHEGQSKIQMDFWLDFFSFLLAPWIHHPTALARGMGACISRKSMCCLDELICPLPETYNRRVDVCRERPKDNWEKNEFRGIFIVNQTA